MLTGQPINQAKSPDPDSPVRTADEIRQAITKLTPAELLRLEKNARWRMRIVPLSCGKTWEDLVQQAIKLTLTGERSWRHGVSFLRHLIGAVRSISTSWREQVGDDPIVTFSSDSVAVPFSIITPERELAAKEELEQIRSLFENDPIALEMLTLLGEGYTGEEIQHALYMCTKEYETTKRRFRRKLDAWLKSQEAIKPSNANFKTIPRSRKTN